MVLYALTICQSRRTAQANPPFARARHPAGPNSLWWSTPCAHSTERITEPGSVHSTSSLSAGKLAITEVVLRPTVVFGGEPRPQSGDVEAMQREAHEESFIAVRSRRMYAASRHIINRTRASDGLGT